MQYRITSLRILSFAGLLLALSPLSLRADNATGTTGNSAGLDTRQPTMVMRYMICVQGGIFPDGVDGTPTQQTPPDRTNPYVGEIKAIPFDYLPRGWAFCEGQLLPINQNQVLFALLGTMYGGNGVTTFGLPDLRGRVPIGAGQGPGLPAYAIGEQVTTVPSSLTSDMLPPHSHTLPSGWSSGTTGRGAPADNRQPALALDFRISANGEIMIVPWSYATTGWTRCDGRLLSSASHALLFQNIGTTFGGDATNFALPDLRGRVVVGDDNAATWPRGLASGSNGVVLAGADIPSHMHSTQLGITGPFGGPGNTASAYQPSLALRWLICTSGVFPSPGNSIASPFVAELRLIAGATATGLPGTTWKMLDGGLLVIDDYDVLFNVIGTTYGGDGQLNYAVPDLRGRLHEHSSNNLPNGTLRGSPTIAISLSQLAAHSHIADLRITMIEHLASGLARL